MKPESAIPEHLRRVRTRHARVGDDYVPRADAISPKFDKSVTRVTVAYLGYQFQPGRSGDRHAAAGAWLWNALADGDGPEVIDRAQFVDRLGWINPMFVCYWREASQHLAWWKRIGRRWTCDADLFRDVGRFSEVLSPSVDRIEAILSVDQKEGLARLAGATTGPIREHGYWGSMRDRIPLGQTDELANSGEFEALIEDGLTRIIAPGNLCVIRTGQDWTAAEADEEDSYFGAIEPSMKVSLEFMNNVGLELGCLCSRYARLVDDSGKPISKAFNTSIWLNLARLEHWAGSHWTHLASYGALARHSMRFGSEMRLSRYHEVVVPARDQMTFEYRNCHESTGLCGIAHDSKGSHRPTSNK